MLSLLSRQGLKYLLSASFILVFVGCASLPGSTVDVVQSPNDNNAYRLLVLDNQLEVLLISDPDTPKAAAALDVMVGSGDNPQGRQGLAHFLEHMLFLGTDKYPDAAEYEEYITEHGGRRNAYTSFEHTNYFFDINAQFLPEALDRFAQFFIAPRFDAEYVDREKNAVEAEYQMGLKSDPRRGLDVIQEVMNPEHPFSQFSVGSLETLDDREGATVRQDLLAFYERHYSANQMKLVVLGNESLDDLEKLVKPMFSPIPNKGFEHDEITDSIFTEKDLPLLVQVKPLATQRELDVSFPVADYREQYHSKPLAYLGNLVGHEGQGSLLSALKAEGLAESLGAGSGLAWRGGALFSLSITLTEKGAQDYERVLALVFAYMDMLRSNGPQEWLFDEQAQLAALGFRFREDSDPMGYVSSTASGMHYYAAGDILQGPYLMTEYRADLLSGLLDNMVPTNAVVTFSDKLAETDRVSNFYQVPYGVERFAGNVPEGWVSGEPSAVALPSPNQFIADDVSLERVAEGSAGVPVRKLENDRQTIWFAQDDQFRVPKGAIYINFSSRAVGKTASDTASAVLYTALLKDAVNEFSYPAMLAGLNFDLYKHAQGISLRISGYNDKQDLLLEQLLATINESSFDPQRFADIRKDMIRSLQNTVAKRPANQAMNDLREALLYGEWGEDALIAALEDIGPAELDAYVKAYWRDAHAETLIYGNYSRSEVDAVAERVSGVLADAPLAPAPELKVLKLAAGESIQYGVDIPHDDSVVAWYLQGADKQWEDKAATAMTAQVMKSGFFQQLRTEQQLGYIASAFAWPQMDVPGLVMLIQSPTASAVDVATAMDTFTRGLAESIDDEQFQRHQSALVAEIRKPDKNMWDRAEYYWQSIARKQFEFDGKDSLAEAVSALDRDSWLAYFNEVFMDQRRSLQVVAPGKWNELPDIGDGLRVNNAGDIKSGHDHYTVD